MFFICSFFTFILFILFISVALLAHCSSVEKLLLVNTSDSSFSFLLICPPLPCMQMQPKHRRCTLPLVCTHALPWKYGVSHTISSYPHQCRCKRSNFLQKCCEVRVPLFSLHTHALNLSQCPIFSSVLPLALSAVRISVHVER